MAEIDVEVRNKIANATFLAMGMVVAIHTLELAPVGSALWLWNELTKNGICLAAVPLFFVCSGFFLTRHCEERGWWAAAVRKRVKSLLIPFVLWCGISIVITVVLIVMANLAHGRQLFSNMSHCCDWWLRAWGCDLCVTPLLVPLWYVRSLMFFILLSPMLVFLLRKAPAVTLGTCYIVWCMAPIVFRGERLQGFFCYTVSAMGLTWFSLGCMLGIREHRADCVVEWVKKHGGELGLVGVVMLMTVVGFEWAMKRQVLGLQPVYIPLILAGFWSLVPERPFPRVLTGATFAIFVGHILMWRVISAVWPLCVSDVATWVLKWLIGFCGALVVGVVLKKGLPRCSEVLFGGR